MEFLVVLLLLIVFVVVLGLKGVYIINQSQTMVIERLGKFHKVLDSGINLIIPGLDKPRSIDWKFTKEVQGQVVSYSRSITKIDLRETLYDFPKQNVITSDNVGIEINAMIYFQLTDAKRAVYEINNLPNAIEKLTQTTLRNVIGEMELDETLSSRDTINSKLREILDEATDKWGVKINRVELQDIIPPRDIKEAMEKQMRAERDRRAKILEAEGQKRSSILEAEGSKESAIKRAEGQREAKILEAQAEKEAKILEAQAQREAKIQIAEAEAQAIQKVADVLKETGGDPTRYLIATKYIETLKEMTEGKDNKVVYLPYEASGVLSSLGGIKELFNESKN